MSDKTTEFINKSTEIHGDKYEYSKVEYEHNLKEVIITCKKHGDFEQLPKTHKRGNGCRDCGLLKRANSKKSNTNEFIIKSKDIHGDKYDYSKVEYIKAMEKVIITCKEHGDFEQTPNGHLDGKGCRKCSTEINSDKQRKTTKQFITEAIQIHNDKYDYSKVVYKNTGEKVIIICKEHGDFLQTPNGHLDGKGCIKCAGCYKSNTEEFVKKSKEIHGDKYDYSNVEYKKVNEKVIITCKEHGDFEQTPNGHLNGLGCFKCGHKMFILSNNDFINKAKEMHGDKYDYSNVEYNKMNEKVIITCKEHGDFEQTPSNHITHKQGCPICGGSCLSNTTEFIEKAIKKHGDKYDYSKVNYINNHTNVIIICKDHNEYEQTPQTHLSGCGCRLCGVETMKTKQKTDIDDFIINANFKHNNKYDYSKINYINARTKIIIICKKHGDFEQQPDSHLRGCGCPYCINKTEFILYDALEQIYPTLIYQFKQEWCKNIHCLPFDFCIPDLKIILELDGPQHFIQVSNWTSPEETFENDLFKEKCANEQGYSVIRIIQEDVFNDKYDWKTELVNNIEKMKTDNIIQNIYMCKNNEYDNLRLNEKSSKTIYCV
jgi:very-short-patch-repair endonuclease